MFSDSSAAHKFDEKPLAYCGILTDPVTRQRFRPGPDSPKTEYNGRPFFFWSESSKEMFEMMPAMYAAPNLSMEEINSQSEN